jgi:hypothetical protein
MRLETRLLLTQFTPVNMKVISTRKSMCCTTIFTFSLNNRIAPPSLDGRPSQLLNRNRCRPFYILLWRVTCVMITTQSLEVKVYKGNLARVLVEDQSDLLIRQHGGSGKGTIFIISFKMEFSVIRPNPNFCSKVRIKSN